MSLFAVYMAVALVFGVVLEVSQMLERLELQSINRRFELRPWFNWSNEGLSRLNPQALLAFHEQHEVPNDWLSWDYTLSWLLEHNHPPVRNHIVIFNRTLEDEPPDEAVAAEPWLKPLQHYPLPRTTMAEMVDFVAKCGAKAIILDNDFPQHAPGDREIAQVIHKWTNTGENGRKVPIFMVGSLNTGAGSHYVELGVPTRPMGILSELRKLEPGVDVESKYLGTTCVHEDKDQVVRSMFTSINVGEDEYRSVVLKCLQALGEPIPRDLPQLMDIDFSCPPKWDLYPIRPFLYLLDPKQRQALSSPKPNNKDVDLRGAIVLIGDSVTDVYSTPFTNEGTNKMSGTEILAHSMDTIARGSWPARLHGWESLAYLLLVCLVGGGTWVAWKSIQHHSPTSQAEMRRISWHTLCADLFVFLLIMGGTYIGAQAIFSYYRVIVPVFVPSFAVLFGTVAAILWERERERHEAFATRLRAAQEKLVLTKEKYESELKRKEAEAKAREILVDRKRRREFVRRINHDLNAPISVLNWTVSELQMIELESQSAREKVSRLVKSSDKLCELVDQLVQSYDYETVPNEGSGNPGICDLAAVVHDSVDEQMPFAAMREDSIEWTKPEKELWVRANPLELTRVVDNIIRNAIKHNPVATKIRVSIEARGAFYEVAISDTGKGIAAEHLNRIFEPGFRVEPGNKDGQGLGLDIAKTLIEGMGGEIIVESVVKRGTTFRLRLPICSDGQEEASGDERVEKAYNFGNGNGNGNGAVSFGEQDGTEDDAAHVAAAGKGTEAPSDRVELASSAKDKGQP